jgi:transposase
VVEGRFPRLWTPDREQRDLRQRVLHRHKLVEIRSRVKNELQQRCVGTHSRLRYQQPV